MICKYFFTETFYNCKPYHIDTLSVVKKSVGNRSLYPPQ